MTEKSSAALRLRREAIGVSQSALAVASGLTTATVGNLEAGLRVRPATRARIEQALTRLEERRVQQLLDELQRLGVDVRLCGPREVAAA